MYFYNMTTKIDEIVSKEALEQVDLLNSKLKETLMLEKKLGGSIALKISVLSDLIGTSTIKVSSENYNLINAKLKELIPLL